MKTLYKAFIATIVLPVIIAGCQEKFDMIAPPTPPSEGGDETAGIFVKTTASGTATGDSWDNALSGAVFFAKVKSGYSPADTVYMAGGTYYVGESADDVLAFTQNINIKGGYDPNSIEKNVEISYPSAYETIFSGDLNKNETGDSGDCRVVDLSGACTVSFTGITVKHGYVSSGADRPGIQIKGGSMLYLNYCKVIDNVSAVGSPTSDAGGAGIYLNEGTANCFKTQITGNKSNNRGGAIRLVNAKDVLVLNSSLVAENSISGDFGGGVQLSNGDSKLYCINSTIANNTAKYGGAGINGAGYVYLVSSTVVNNYCTNAKEGHDMRLESINKTFFINSIITGSSSKISATAPNIFINGADKNVTSKGNNIIGAVAGTGSMYTITSDATGRYYADIFGTNDLADNDGFPQTIALSSNIEGADIMTMYTYALANVPYGDVTLDQRGVTRNDPASVGAFEYK